MSEHYSFDTNPWKNDYFKPAPLKKGPNPIQRQKSRSKPIPDQREVFAIQKNLTRALEALSDIESEHPTTDTSKLRQPIESAYRKVVRYLDSFAQ